LKAVIQASPASANIFLIIHRNRLHLPAGNFCVQILFLHQPLQMQYQQAFKRIIFIRCKKKIKK
jgi:hypothetical protein